MNLTWGTFISNQFAAKAPVAKAAAVKKPAAAKKAPKKA
jgi:hypothetical protein